MRLVAMMPYPLRVFLTALWLGCILIAVILLASSAWAQPQIPECGTQSGMLSRLERTFEEKLIWEGAFGPPEAGATEVVTQSFKGSWTRLICVKGGCCIKAVGFGGKFLRGA